MKNLFKLIVISIILFNCNGDSYYEKKQKELNIEKRNYNTLLSETHKSLIYNLYSSTINQNVKTPTKKETILVVQKRKGKIIPYIEINKKLKKKGFNITYDSEKLDYIIAVKTKGIKKGEYTDGSTAFDNETKIFAIDLEKKEYILFIKEYKKAPKKIQKRRGSEKGNYGARGIEGNELVSLIIDKILQ